MMTLKKIHDFELKLLDPLLKMSERGVTVDKSEYALIKGNLNTRVTDLTNALNKLLGELPKEAPLTVIKPWRCPCCRHAKKKQQACWSCAGYSKAPTKKAEKSKLSTCSVCQGLPQSKPTKQFNPASPNQVAWVLYDHLKLMSIQGRSTDEESLKGLLRKSSKNARNKEIVQGLLDLRKTQTMIKILGRMEPGPDGKLRTFYSPCGTETRRLSSRGGTPTGERGYALEVSTNLQNLPKKTATNKDFNLRRVLVPDRTKDFDTFIEADLSQAEARVVAALTKDEALLKRWENPEFDVHRWTASKIFSKPADAITKEERYLGKVARHALNYGMGYVTFQRNVNHEADVTGVMLSQTEAMKIYKAYHKVARLQPWWNSVFTTLNTVGELWTPMGRRRRFYGRRTWKGQPAGWLDQVHKEAIAFVPQSTVADILNKGLVDFYFKHDLKKPWVEVLMQVHDSVLVQTKAKYAKAVSRQLKTCLEQTISINGVDVTIPADVSTGKSWGSMEECT